MSIQDIHNRVETELKFAIEKFPTWPNTMLDAFAIVQEEIGEAQKDILQFYFEPHKGKTETDIQNECIQSIAMLYRFLISMQTGQYNLQLRGDLQHKQIT